jgi:hypothetical protein
MGNGTGLKLVADAIAAQITAGYSADSWMALTLEPMTKLWQGIGGQSPFFFSEEDARAARGAYSADDRFQFAETLWRLGQVKPNPQLGYRPSIREFVVDLHTPAAVGICNANRKLGSGSLLQYYAPTWRETLRETGREHVFPHRSFPVV